jgi:hypothetical protein
VIGFVDIGFVVVVVVNMFCSNAVRFHKCRQDMSKSFCTQKKLFAIRDLLNSDSNKTDYKV